MRGDSQRDAQSSERAARRLVCDMSRKDTHPKSSPSKPNMAALGLAGLSTGSGQRLLAFPVRTPAPLRVAPPPVPGSAGGGLAPPAGADPAQCAAHASFLFRFCFRFGCPDSTGIAFSKTGRI